MIIHFMKCFYNAFIENCPFLIPADIKKQRSVNLDYRKRKPHYRIQICISGTKIIQTKTDASGRKFLRNSSQTCIVFSRNRFRDFKLYPVMWNLISIHNPDKMSATVISHQIQRRQIHFYIQKMLHQIPVFSQKSADTAKL